MRDRLLRRTAHLIRTAADRLLDRTLDRAAAAGTVTDLDLITLWVSHRLRAAATWCAAWASTRDVAADPALSAILRQDADDYGPVPRPEVPWHVRTEVTVETRLDVAPYRPDPRKREPEGGPA